MSFIKTLAALAAGFAAAKGYDRFRKTGGMAALEKQMRGAAEPGGIADQAGALAERMGLPGGKEKIRDLVAGYAPKAADAGDAAAAGIGGLMASLGGAYASGSGKMAEMVAAMTGATPAGPMVEENARLMIRAMIAAAKADGEIDAAEQERIMQHLGDASAEERAFVEAELAAAPDMAALVAATGAAMRTQVYATSVMAIRPDAAAEVAYLRRLAEGLGLDAASRDAIHASMGVPPLPAA